MAEPHHRKPSGEIQTRVEPIHECSQEHRLAAVEHRLDDQSTRLREAEGALHDGRVEFAEIRKDLAQIMLTLAELKVQIAGKPSDFWGKVQDSAIFWATPLICGGILWSIFKSGQVPGVTP